MDIPDLIFVIPTDRLRDVGEAVEEYDQHFWRNGHTVRIVVFDDSSPANQQKYFPLLEQTRTHNELFYVGPTEKDQFLGYLNQRLRDPRLEIARAAGLPLRIAGKIYPEERGYFEQRIAPLLRQSAGFVDFTGELGGVEKNQFLGQAKALLFPIDWPEPFGLVMIDAMACGTPTIGWCRGSVPEVIDDGVTGFIVDTVEDAARAVDRIDSLDRARCRRVFEERFDAARMARDYVQVYGALC